MRVPCTFSLDPHLTMYIELDADDVLSDKENFIIQQLMKERGAEINAAMHEKVRHLRVI